MVADRFKGQWVINGPGPSDFNATALFINTLVEGMRQALEIDLSSVLKPLDHILMQLTLVAFEGQDVIGVLVDDGPRNLCLATHGINGHDTSGNIQVLEQFRDSTDFIRFLIHFSLA